MQQAASSELTCVLSVPARGSHVTDKTCDQNPVIQMAALMYEAQRIHLLVSSHTLTHHYGSRVQRHPPPQLPPSRIKRDRVNLGDIRKRRQALGHEAGSLRPTPELSGVD